jgi:hypothetical protein
METWSRYSANSGGAIAYASDKFSAMQTHAVLRRYFIMALAASPPHDPAARRLNRSRWQSFAVACSKNSISDLGACLTAKLKAFYKPQGRSSRAWVTIRELDFDHDRHLQH